MAETPIKAKYPTGIPYIIGNEAAERFSYYGMRAILVIFMTKYLLDNSGALAPMSEQDAKTWYHMFSMGSYLFPVLGALIADVFLGKYRTILFLSVVYCFGHAALAAWETRFGLGLGLLLIAIGSGGIKPCVASHLGDQFTNKNSSLMAKAYSMFYFSVNFGSVFSVIITPIVLEKYGSSWAFGIPGILMALATLMFWLGRHRYVAIPAVGWKKYKESMFTRESLVIITRLMAIFFFQIIFASLYFQTGSSWVLQAEKLNRFVDLRFGPFQYEWLQFELLASQIQSINPIMVMLFIPALAWGVYPLISRFFPLNALRKIGIGMFICAISFALVAYTQELIDAGQTPSMMYQFWAFFIITIAEVMINVPFLEFTYTQAPPVMKSFITSIYYLTISLGNLLTAAITAFASGLTGAAYFWLFAIMMLVAAVLFVFVAMRYKSHTYIQDHSALR